MQDNWEKQFNLDPSDFTDSFIDSDQDGLMNILEFQLTTSPNSPDSDSDSLPDLWEFLYHSNPIAEDSDEDTDEDGIPNWYEHQNGLNGLLDDAFQDNDGDGVSNLQEYLAGTNPRDFWSFPLESLSTFLFWVVILAATLGGIGITRTLFQRSKKARLMARMKTSDYPTALRMLKAGFSDYTAFLQAETDAKAILKEGIEAYYQNDYASATQKYNQALSELHRLHSIPLVAEAGFRLALILKEQNMLTKRHPVLERFPTPPYIEARTEAFSQMLQALNAETGNNWGAAKENWKVSLSTTELETDYQIICQRALVEISLRTWFYDQSYEKKAQFLSQINEWRELCEISERIASFCPYYLMLSRFALASYDFEEVQKWLDECLKAAKRAGLEHYIDLIQKESTRLAQHKERIQLLFKADQLLSPEDKGKLLQQYIRTAVLTIESVEN